jgi:hypothetical protein
MDIFESTANLVTPLGIVSPLEDTVTEFIIKVDNSLATTEASYSFVLRGNFPGGNSLFSEPITLRVQCGPASTTITQNAFAAGYSEV